MFKKFLAAVLVLGFVCAAPVMAQAKGKVDYSSKAGLIKSMVIAIQANNADMLWACLSPEFQKGLTDLAKFEKKSMKEFKASFLAGMKKGLQDLEKKNYTVDKIVQETLKFPNYPVNKVDGKWYFHPIDNSKDKKK